MLDNKKLKVMSLSEIKKLQEYIDIPQKYGKTKLTKKELIALILKLNKKSKVSKLKIDEKIIKKEKENTDEILSDLKKTKNPKFHDELLKKYNLVSQREYLLDLVKLKLYNDSISEN